MNLKDSNQDVTETQDHVGHGAVLASQALMESLVLAESLDLAAFQEV